MSNLEIITTSDGSNSLLNTQLNETYHSVHGALQESIHVFITNGLDFFNQRSPSQINILEVGFGTGLNALLTVQYAEKNKTEIHYTTLEAFPIDAEIWKQLNYAEALADKEYFQKLHSTEWDEEVLLTPDFSILKINETLEKVTLNASSFDLIYFDAFAPNKQPKMWELPILEKIVLTMKPHGVFVTYCAKGQLKRDLKSLGLNVETLPGPPGKKEMVRAIKL
jgi:tRNA U34 5-methylaminomethyl-2-thiouridine-forming methyltransferase MnmC